MSNNTPCPTCDLPAAWRSIYDLPPTPTDPGSPLRCLECSPPPRLNFVASFWLLVLRRPDFAVAQWMEAKVDRRGRLALTDDNRWQLEKNLTTTTTDPTDFHEWHLPDGSPVESRATPTDEYRQWFGRLLWWFEPNGQDAVNACGELATTPIGSLETLEVEL